MAAAPLYFEDEEDSVLRNFLDEEMHQNVQTSSPILEHPEEHGFMSNPAQGKQKYESPEQHSSSSHSRKHSRTISGSTTTKNPDALLRRLTEQTREANTLRRALQLAVDRMRENANDAAYAERSRVQAETAEYFHKLNEKRIAAQQEALQASQDLRIYQTELQSAQEEIRRARGLLSLAEQERDGAFQAAREAREQTRELYRRYMMDYSWHSAKEDGMRAGIEEGIRRERMRMYGDDSEYEENTPPQPAFEDLHRQPIQPMDTAASQGHVYSQTQTYVDSNVRSQDPAPNVQVVPPRDAPVEPPVPVTFPHPDPAPTHGSYSPAVQVYEVDIPSATALERQYSTRSVDPIRKSRGPWLTAEQHMALRNVEQNIPNPPQPQNINVTFLEPQQPVEEKPKKQKESWYRTLRRKLSGKKSKPENISPYGPYSKYSESGPEPQDPPTPPQPQSWYVAKNGPHVLSSEVGVQVQPSVDSATTPRSIDPLAAGNASQRSGRSGYTTRRGRAESLSIIVEDPRSGISTPLQNVRSGKPKLRSVSMDQGDMASLHPSIGQSSYVQPAATETWHSSQATGIESQNAPPPRRGPRRPSVLTVPAPLSLDVPGAVPPGAFESASMSDASGFLRPPARTSGHNSDQSDPVGPPPPSAPIGIAVQSPSNSPSETTGSAFPDRGYLSPGSSTHTSRTRSQQPEAAPVARPPSRSHHLASPTPLLDSPQAPPNILGLTSPTDPSKPPVPRKSPMPLTMNLLAEEPRRPASRVSQRSRAAHRTSPEKRARNTSDHMRTASEPQWGTHTPSVRSRKTTLSTDNGGRDTPNGGTHEGKLIRVPSNNSLNIPNSPYAKFKSMDYVDPAFFDHNGAGYRGSPLPTHSGTPRRSHSRAASSQSSLGFYIEDPKLKGGSLGV